VSESRLVLVERFEELTPGVRLAVLCDVCEGGTAKHDTMVIAGPRVATVETTTGIERERLVPCAPNAPCQPKPGTQGFAVTAYEVEMRRIWRWVDFDPESEAADARSLRISERVR
jgi:hypothetical protein